MERAKLWSVAFCLLIINICSFSLTGNAQDTFPSNQELAQCNCALEIIGFNFASGLSPNEKGKPNGNGVQLLTAKWGGSGFIVKDDGEIVTNYHVAKHAQSGKAIFDDGSSYAISQIKAYQSGNDIAILKINSTQKFPTVILGNSDSVAVRDQILAVGNPLGMGINVTQGNVSRLVKFDQKDLMFITHTAPIAPGSSGGTLYKGKEVIGINSSVAVSQFGMTGFSQAIPSNKVKELLGTNAGDSAKPLVDVFPTSAKEMISKLQQVSAQSGQVPSFSNNIPGSLSFEFELFPLVDYAFFVQCPGQNPALLITDDQNNTLGIGDLPEKDFDMLLLSAENYKKIIISVLNFDASPVNFGLTVSKFNW